MAKITGFVLPKMAPSLKGTVVVSSWRGIPYIAKWPRKRPNITNPKTLAQMDWFLRANKLIKYINTDFQISAMNATKGTPLYPRDVQVQLMAGTILAVKFGKNEISYPVATQRAVSESLDVFLQTPGGILVRNTEFWEMLEPGNEGKVLTTHTAGSLPTWETPSGGGGGLWEEVAEITAPTAGVFDFTGLDLSTYRAIKIIGTDLEAQTAEGFMLMEVYDNGVLVTTGYQWAFQGYSTSNFSRTVRDSSDPAIALTMTGTNWGIRPLTGRGANFEMIVFNPTKADKILTSGTEVHEQVTGMIVNSLTHSQLPISTVLDGFKFTEPTNGIAAGLIKIIGMQ